ncbi:MAG: hypothetical protein C5B49_01500 [Bdellovibrio sp.]|nr:MAG: hypothetical protein C5B49_01500 [Bdellovibrio sp.]
MSLIEARDISMNYRLEGGRVVPVLRHVSFSVERGEMVAILGPSGSGKSTLLSIIGCYLRPSSGSYRWQEMEVTEASDSRLARLRSSEIGFVFQQFHLLPRANLIENLTLGSAYQHAFANGGAEEKAAELLARVGLASHQSHFPNQLSGGQQQRAAIARALMTNPALILADEPTGNLDSKSAEQIMGLFEEVHQEGRSLILITHNQEIAARCERVMSIRDGVLHEEGAFPRSPPRKTPTRPLASVQVTPNRPRRRSMEWSVGGEAATGVQVAWRNLQRYRSRSWLTMMGVIIGIAAVLSTITLGSYTRKKIIESYESLGVNKLMVRVYPRWYFGARDKSPVTFEQLQDRTDLTPLRKLFPEIRLLSPVLQVFTESIEFGGRAYKEARILGVNDEYFQITRRRLLYGRGLNRFHVDHKRRVCVLGYEVARQLFSRQDPLGRIVSINGNSVQYTCQVLGVLAEQKSNSEWFNPNRQILMPVSLVQMIAQHFESQVHEVNVQVRPGASLTDLTTKIKQFFHLRYGRSAVVRVDSDDLLVEQLKKFLNLFTLLLTSVAVISLIVGGIGIANMMFISVNERLREIGLRKALGARDSDIRRQFFLEAMLLSGAAGMLGLVLGVAGYHLLLFLAGKVFTQVHFEWVFNVSAIVISVASIIAVGILSGLFPALRAERLQITEALRSE